MIKTKGGLEEFVNFVKASIFRVCCPIPFICKVIVMRYLIKTRKNERFYFVQIVEKSQYLRAW